MASSINASTSGPGGVITTADNSGILNLQSGGTTVATVNSAGMTTVGTVNVPNTFGFKNRIINGAMVINQRGFNGAGGTNGTYTLDRWGVQNNSGSSRYTVSQNAGSVTPPVGYTNYLGITSSGAYSLASTDVIGIYQQIEGYNAADLGWGTANAKTVTLSFWVRSSLTGTFTAALLEGNTGSVSYPATYNIATANTWQYVTITVPGPTSGSFQTGNLSAIQVLFNLGTGSTFLGTPNTWLTGSYYAATGQTNLVGTNGATFYITGVQLELGSQATSFDVRSIGTELNLCCRYYQNMIGIIGSGFAGSAIFSNQEFPVQMRAAPTAGVTGPINFTSAGIGNFIQSSANINVVGTFSTHQAFVSFGNFSGITSYAIYLINANTNYMTLSAEL